MKPTIFILMGRSGCGKGTQAKLLIDFLNSKDNRETLYVSTGEEFRKIMSANNFTSQKAGEIVDAGRFGPAFLASMLWANILTREYKEGEHIIIDGSPRTLPEAAVLDTTFDFYGVKPVILIVNVSEEWAMDKLLKRGRHDDSREKIESRLGLYRTSIMPIIERYKTENKLQIIEVNGEQSIEAVHEDIKKALEI